jgi:hypothetical protein
VEAYQLAKNLCSMMISWTWPIQPCLPRLELSLWLLSALVNWHAPRIMRQCAEAGFKNLSVAETCLDRDVVDYGFDEFEIPSAYADLVDASCWPGSSVIGFKLQCAAHILQPHFACTWKRSRKGQISCINFLVCEKPTWADLNLVVLPWTLHGLLPTV